MDPGRWQPGCFAEDPGEEKTRVIYSLFLIEQFPSCKHAASHGVRGDMCRHINYQLIRMSWNSLSPALQCPAWGCLKDGWLGISCPFPLPGHYCAALLCNRDATGKGKRKRRTTPLGEHDATW